MMRPQSISPLRIRSKVRQLMPRSASTTALFPQSKHTPKHCIISKLPRDSVEINKENYRLQNQCKAQSKTISLLEHRLDALKAENDDLKQERDDQNEVLKKIKAKFLYVPHSEVLSRQCIELKAKADSYKMKCNTLRKTNHKLLRQNKSYKEQLQNTNTALHNLLSKKYLILQSADDCNGEHVVHDQSEQSESVGTNPTTKAMQKDIENLEKLIENLDYAKNPDLKQLQKENELNQQNQEHESNQNDDENPEILEEENKEYLNVEKILFEHGSLQNDNRDLALEIVVQQETNAKLAQSVNDLWLFSNQLLLKLEKQSTWKRYSNRKVVYIHEQLTTFKKMYHRTRFYFGQMAMDFKKQMAEMRRIVNEVLHQNAEYREELNECGNLRVQVMESKSIIERFETQLLLYKDEKRAIIDRYESIIAQTNGKAMQFQNEKDLLLQKLDSLMTKHSL